MKNTKVKILVLSDLTDQSINVVKSASKIAQVINGEIELFHVRKPTKVVEKESTLSAVRVLKDHYVSVDKKLKAQCDTISENIEVSINHSFSFGNLKNEIEDIIFKTKPDIIVLGKRTSKTPRLFGDNVLSFLLKNFEGSVLLATNDLVLEKQTELSLGLFNDTHVNSDIPGISSIVSSTARRIRSFTVEKKNTESLEKQKVSNDKLVSYIFEENDKTLKNMSNYMQKDKINLLLINRKSKPESYKKGLSISALNELAYSTNVPLLIAN